MTVYHQFEDTIEKISNLKSTPDSIVLEPIAFNKWSIREIVGHLLYWDKFFLEEMVPKMKDGDVLPAFPNHDPFNEAAVRYIESYRTFEEIVAAFINTRTQLVREISVVDPKIIFYVKEEANVYSTATFLNKLVIHDLHHLKQIRVKLEDE